MPHIKAHDDSRRDFLYYASADVQAMSSIEVDNNGVDSAPQITMKWHGPPVFICRRDRVDIKMARSIKMVRSIKTDMLRDKENRNANKPGLTATDENFSLNKARDFDGCYRPCNGSHYDSDRRIEKAPATENLHIPVNTFFDATTIQLG